MNNRTKNNKGFTLTELIVAMALSVIVSLAIYTMFDNALKISSLMVGEIRVIQDIRVVLEKMDRDISQTDLNKSAILTYDDPDFTYTNNQKILTAIAFPRAYGPEDTLFQTDEKTGMPVWKTFRIYYRMENEDNLHIKDVPLSQIRYSIDKDLSYKWNLDKSQVRSLCNGQGDLMILCGNVSCFNIQETLEKVNIRDKRSIGQLDLYLNLYYRNKENMPSFYRIHRTFFARNSAYVDFGPDHTEVIVKIPPDNAPRNPVDKR